MRQPSSFSDVPMGIRMSLALPGRNVPVWTFLVGMEKDRYILLRLPGQLNGALLKQDRVIVKFMKENLVYGFNTTVLHVMLRPFALVFLGYPDKVEHIDLRHHERAVCFLQVEIFWDGEQYPGFIVDLSRGGCRMVVDLTSHSELAALVEGSALFCHFNLGNHEIYAPGEVRNITHSPGKLALGVGFKDLSPEAAGHVDLYVKRINEIRMG